jgi:hypothetical protein
MVGANVKLQLSVYKEMAAKEVLEDSASGRRLVLNLHLHFITWVKFLVVN